MKYYLSFLMLVLSFMTMAQADYLHAEFITDNGMLQYRYLIPENLEQQEKYPVVLFLHGAGERGNDNQKQLTHGAQMFLNPVIREQYPAFVYFPQCPEGLYWNLDARPNVFEESAFRSADELPTDRIILLAQFIDSLSQLPNIDPQRIYIIGLSMGAMATFELTWRYPQLITAAIPICGAANTKYLSNATNVSFRIYHGDNDDVVPVTNSRNCYKALRNADADVTYIEFPGCNHGSWNPAFNDKDLLPWLFNQKKHP